MTQKAKPQPSGSHVCCSALAGSAGLSRRCRGRATQSSTGFIWQETGPTKVICKKHQLAQRVRDLPRLISLFRSGELGSFHHLKFLPTTKYTYIYGTRSELSELSISNKPLFTYYSSDVEF